MSLARRPYIAREGWPFIMAAGIAAGLLQYGIGIVWALPLWLAAILLLYLFRDPERNIPAAPLGVISPVDGQMMSIDDGRDPYLDREAIILNIRMHILGTYVVRSPVEGKIVKQWYISPGSPYGGEEPDLTEGGYGSESCVRYVTWLRTDESDDVVLVVRTASRIMPPCYYVQTGDRIGQGRRCGLIRFGADVEVFIPANSRIDVNTGDHVVSGSDIVATLIHK